MLYKSEKWVETPNFPPLPQENVRMHQHLIRNLNEDDYTGKKLLVKEHKLVRVGKK